MTWRRFLFIFMAKAIIDWKDIFTVQTNERKEILNKKNAIVTNAFLKTHIVVYASNYYIVHRSSYCGIADKTHKTNCQKKRTLQL